jgi:hypothetical protein
MLVTSNKRKPAKSDAALLDIRKALEKGWLALRRRFPPKLNARVQANVPKHERAKFKSFLLTVNRFGDVDLEKVARRVRVSKELLDKWMNTPEISRRVNHFLNLGRESRAWSVVSWAKVLFKQGHARRKAPLTNADEIPPDGIDYGNMLPLAKQAAVSFERPELFRASIEFALTMQEVGGLSSAKQFFIDLGKCLSHGRRGTQRIEPKWWDKLDLDIADIILCHNPPISDEDAVHELKNRGHPPMSKERFRTRKHRLIHDAQTVWKRC